MDDEPLDPAFAELKPFNGSSIVAVVARACESCSFCVKEQADLTCHKGPPQVTFMALPTMQPGPRGPQQGLAIQNYSGWPIVRRDQWCGAFEARRST